MPAPPRPAPRDRGRVGALLLGSTIVALAALFAFGAFACHAIENAAETDLPDSPTEVGFNRGQVVWGDDPDSRISVEGPLTVRVGDGALLSVTAPPGTRYRWGTHEGASKVPTVVLKPTRAGPIVVTLIASRPNQPPVTLEYLVMAINEPAT